MYPLRHIVLVRHGETDGQSSVRFHGASDVDLSAEGVAHMRALGARLRHVRLDAVVASPLRRSWRSAQLVGNGAPVRIETDFREIDFGRWEGLTAEEIQATDPSLYQDWQSKAPGFEFPNGEPRAAFRARVEAGVQRLVESSGGSALVVVHKGVIRAIAQALTGEAQDGDGLELGEMLELHREGQTFVRGRVGSNPPSVDSNVSLEVQAPAA
ncbi:MAG: histidine phosphatase family protein [Myxococcales bacterium]|nr:histidine phosphatase family protein [Myxococcales bacterium]